MNRPFRQIDVFGSGPFTGNPVAVVARADGLTTEQMKSISAWTNLSECTFLLSPTDEAADYRVRIFSLRTELPFAGHPTLGTARAWIDGGGTPRTEGVVVQECAAGRIPVRYEGDSYRFAAPPTIRSGTVEREFLDELTRLIGVDGNAVVDASWVDNGPGWVGILLSSAEAVLALEPSLARYRGPAKFDVGIIGAYPAGSECAFELRAFFADHTGALREDPVTGSLNASAAQWLLATGRARAPYVARQGTRLGRAGRITITQDDAELWVGGTTFTAITGEIDT